MKTTLKNHIFTFSLFALLINTCAKDADEDLTVDEETFIKQMNREHRIEDKKLLAVADWDKFLKETGGLIESTENNLKSLQAKIDNAPASQQPRLKLSYQSSTTNFESLKDSLHAHERLFQKYIKNYDRKMLLQQKDFKRELRKNLLGINDDLQRAIDNP